LDYTEFQKAEDALLKPKAQPQPQKPQKPKKMVWGGGGRGEGRRGEGRGEERREEEKERGEEERKEEGGEVASFGLHEVPESGRQPQPQKPQKPKKMV
jgi:hypothetical protein